MRLANYTQISIDKVLALLSSESYVYDENLTNVSQLNPSYDTNDITKIAQLAVAVFVTADAITPLAQLPKIHIKFLQALVQDNIKTEDDAWKCAIGLATSHGLSTLAQYIKSARPCKTIPIVNEQITPDIAFVLALHSFITNNNRPHDAMSMSKKHSEQSKEQSKVVIKLTADMCMASYGLGWILETETQTSDYINKHMNTYILSY